MNYKLMSGLLFQFVQFFAAIVWILVAFLGNISINSNQLAILVVSVLLLGFNILSIVLIIVGFKQE